MSKAGRREDEGLRRAEEQRQSPSLLAPVAALDAGGERRQHLVGNGVEGCAEGLDGARLFAEDEHFVPLGDLGHLGDVDHTGIHTHVAYGRAEDAVHGDRIGAIAEPTAEAIGIAYRDDGEACGALRQAAAAIADTFARGELSQLQDDGREAGYRGDTRKARGADAVESEAEARHIPPAEGIASLEVLRMW